jgi:hypothetical protein
MRYPAEHCAKNWAGTSSTPDSTGSSSRVDAVTVATQPAVFLRILPGNTTPGEPCTVGAGAAHVAIQAKVHTRLAG